MPVDILPVNEEEYESNDGSTQKEDAESGSEADYLKSKLWYALLPVRSDICLITILRWLGFLLMNIGEIGNFISYAFAPASVVAPLGTVRKLDRQIQSSETDISLFSLL